MAKLERVTAKVFASDAPADKIGQFGSALAGTKLETGDVSTIQALPAYTEGWSSAVISQRNYPVLQETNGVMKNMSYQTAYIMQNGIAEYDPDTEYYTGSICKGIGNTNQYASWGDENVGNDVTNSQYWKNVTPVNYSNITNCITEIPQRIKLELNNGTLTLKAGSEVRTVTNLISIDADISYTAPTNFPTVNFLISVTVSGNALTQSELSNSASAEINPNKPYMQWFNTADSKCYVNDGNGAIEQEITLPIAIVECVNGTGFTKIKQVFNGMGYIGAFRWVDRGIKSLHSLCRNNDGTINNLELITDFISYVSTFGVVNEDRVFGFYANGVPFDCKVARYLTGLKKDLPTTLSDSSFYCYFCTDTLEFFATIGSTTANWKKQISAPVIAFSYVAKSNQQIENMIPKQPFRAVDYNEIDGIWVNKRLELTYNAIMSNTAETSYSLSNYLPDDGGLYQVKFFVVGNASGTYQSNYTMGFDWEQLVFSLKDNFTNNFIGLANSTRLLRIMPTTLCSGTTKLSITFTAYRKVR